MLHEIEFTCCLFKITTQDNSFRLVKTKPKAFNGYLSQPELPNTILLHIKRPAKTLLKMIRNMIAGKLVDILFQNVSLYPESTISCN